MKILVASAFQASSRFAHAINTIKIADGFSKLGHDVLLVCRRPPEGPVSLDRLRADFSLSPTLDIRQVASSIMGSPLNNDLHFGLQVAAISIAFRPDLAYSRSYTAPSLLARLGIPTIAESHAHPGNASKAFLGMVRAARQLETFRALVTIAPVLKQNFLDLGVPAEKIHVLADAVDLDLFVPPAGYQKELRDRPKIVYAGHLYDYKGIPTIIDAAAALPSCDFILVGGTQQDINRASASVEARGLSNVRLVGLLPFREVPRYLWEADVLLLPPSAHHPSAQWTSPVKLGEYLASGTPVVATRIPALEYWLRGHEVLFVAPDDGAALARGVTQVLGDKGLAETLARNGRSFAQGISYRERCRSMICRAPRE